MACKNCPNFALRRVIFSFFHSLCQKELNELKPNPPHDSINDLLGLNICFCFGGCSIFQFLLEGILGSLAGVSLTGQFAGSLETVVSTGFGSLKDQIRFKISSQRAQNMFKTCSSQVEIKLKYNFIESSKDVQNKFKRCL